MKYIAALLTLFLILPVIAQPPVSPYCGTQMLYFQHQESPDLPGYEELVNAPSGNAEIDENITIKSTDGPVLIDSYILPSGSLSQATYLLKGLRTFTTYHYVDTASGTTRINFTAFQRFQNGTEIIFYSQLSDDIDALTVSPYTTYRVSQQDLKLSPTDRLGIKVYGETTHAANVKLHFVYQGAVHTSHFMSGSFYCEETKINAQVGPGSMAATPLSPYTPIVALIIIAIAFYIRSKGFNIRGRR